MRSRLIAVVVLAIAVSGLIQAPAAQAASAIGDCYYYPGTTKISSDAPPVSCDAPHTAQTYWVSTLPDSFGIPAKASAAARRSATVACTPAAINAFTGMPQRTLPSRFDTFAIFPSSAQWAAGERTVRCDVVLRNGAKLVTLTQPAAAVVASTPQEQLNYCTPAEPNANAPYAGICNNPKKNFIKLLAKDLGKAGSKFPGYSTVERKVTKLCQALGRKYKGNVPFPGYWGIWPTGTGWAKGDRAAQCFVPLKQYLDTLAKQASSSAPAPPAATG
jgi:hypothetical protein